MTFKKFYNKIKKVILKYYLPFEINYIRRYDKEGKAHTLDKELIISLTSYHLRFKTLPLTLKCLLSQTVQVDKVILWIGFEDESKLTDEIKALTQYGLTIQFHKDIRSFTKIIPALEENQDRYIITVDDDLYYPKDLVEGLLNASLNYPDGVIANRTHKIKLNDDELPEKYSNWYKRKYDNTHPHLNFLTGVGGVLYPPNIFFEDVLKEEIFLKLSPTSDDAWLYWMVRLNNKFVYNSGIPFSIFTWSGSQESALIHNDNKGNGNDKQIYNLINYYGFDKLR
jgi:hypothetical protein